MTYAEYIRYLSRRVGPAFAAEASAASLADAIDNPTPAPLPAGWGTSPRRAPRAASYKPDHGGYPGRGEGMTPINRPWIKWNGGECPVMRDQKVMIKLRSGHVTGPVFAANCMWKHHNYHADIVEYHAAAEKADLEAAARRIFGLKGGAL